jgi:hypothetical protein
MTTLPISQSVRPVTLNRGNDTLLYKLASAICDPLQSIDHAVLQFVVARVAICVVSFFATNGILTILALWYVDAKDKQIITLMEPKRADLDMIPEIKTGEVLNSEETPSAEDSEKSFNQTLIKVRLQLIAKGSMKESDFSAEQLVKSAR